MMRHRHSRILESIPFLLPVLLFAVFAQAQYSGGKGTAQAPYQIATAADLIALGGTPGDYDKHFVLTTDIDLDPNLPGRRVFDKAVIAPDANSAQTDFQGTPFTGVLDGGGHTIWHLTMKGGSCLGLFGQSQGEIRNLGVAGVEITGSGDAVGGLVGWNQGIVTQCYSAGAVAGEASVGGLVGQNEGRVTQCHSSGSADGNDLVGGLVGSNGFDSSPGLIGQCYSAGAVIGRGLNVGGLVGRQPRSGSAAVCFWDTQTSGRTTSAGGAGKTTAEMHTAKIFLDVGWDFVGETKNGTEDVWWILEGKDYPRLRWEQAVKYGGGTAKSTAEMRTAATFLTAGWDFVGEIANGTEDIWQIQEGKDYPRLRWQQENAGP